MPSFFYFGGMVFCMDSRLENSVNHAFVFG